MRRTIEQAGLVGNHEAADLLGHNFAGAETDVGLLKELIAWSGNAVAHSEQLHALLGGECVDEARAQAVAVVGLEETAMTLLGMLTERAKVDLALLSDRSSFRKTAEQLSAAGTDPEGLFSCASFALLADL